MTDLVYAKLFQYVYVNDCISLVNSEQKQKQTFGYRKVK